MRHNFYGIISAAIVVVASLAAQANAEDSCCAHCGCKDGCEKVCRLVCEDKKVEIICWGCKCEHFCVPGPSKPGCKHCKMVCESCDEAADCPDCTVPHGGPHKFVWKDWIPGCATVHTRKKLMQKKETVKVPSYKWVVEDLCAKCEAKTQSAEVQPGAEVPAPPTVAARLKPARAMAAIPNAAPSR